MKLKNLFFPTLALLLTIFTATAQVNVPVPEFINSYCILTSDSTIDVLPKENGTIGKHQTKVKGVLNKVGKAAKFAGAAGALGAVVGAHTGNLSGVVSGIKTAQTAVHVADVASTASALAGAEGMDIIFKGSTSSYTYNNNGEDINLLIKSEANDEDPMGIYRIVRFKVVGKERRIQWMEFEPAFLSTDDAKAGGYIYFTGHKYGEQSYLLTIPAAEIEEGGEFGIFFMNIITATAIPVGTFSVK